jgi:hypothetical protein
MQDGRWLVVNIQTHEEFASHMLNRDTWVDETIESILRTTYMLWQRGHTSGDGAAYMRLYHLTEEDLPHIGIIDPRTGAKLLTLTVSFLFCLCALESLLRIVWCNYQHRTNNAKHVYVLHARDRGSLLPKT